MKRGTKIATGAVAGLALVGGGFALANSDRSSSSAKTVTTETTVARSTAKVERRKLGKETRYSGTLKYTDSRTLTTPAASAGGTRTVTSIVSGGSSLEQGTVIYELDNLPTVTLTGTRPMYRSLSRGVSAGADIRQLEQNLIDLGHDPDRKIVVDDVYDDATVNAVNKWEESLGLAADGKVDQSQVVFLPGRAVVSKVYVSVGGQAAGGSGLVDVVVTESKVSVGALVAGKVGNVNANAQPAAGEVLYELDDKAVVTLIGDSQITRALKEGDSGADVRLLQQNLLAMGYGTSKTSSKSSTTTTSTTDSDAKVEKLVANSKFDVATRQAVERMQFDSGRKVTGSLALGDVTVLPRGYSISSRIDTKDKTDAKATVKRNDELFTLTRVERVVTLDVVLADKDKVKVGTSARIAIPGGEDVTAKVTTVSPVGTNTGTGAAKKDATFTATLIVESAVEGEQVELPVDVYIDKVVADDVLAVPVSAIIAVAGGGFAVETTDGRRITVETGETASNFIAITGEGIEEGLEVMIP
jgi:peptidoglycan hydrolase-like protein with peptidoglycan-binding domain